MMQIKNHFAPDPTVINKLVELGMKGEEGRKLVQQYYFNPPPWMTPSEARLYVPLAAERISRIQESVQKINPPQSTVAEDKVAGLAGLPAIAPQGAPQMQQPKPAQQAQAPMEDQGVASLPVPENMFQEQSMAGGGIVAFEDGGEVQRFQNQGLVSLRSPELRAQLDLLKRQYDATPEGTPEKVQLAQAIEAILAADTATPQTAPAAQAQLTAPAATAPTTAPAVPPPTTGLSAANAEIGLAKKGIADLMGKMELSPEEVKKRSQAYMTERGAAGADFRTTAEELMKKQEGRVAEIDKNADLRTAFNFFTNLAASKSPFFGVAAGEAGGKALEYFEALEDKKQRAQAAFEASQINYNLARAAEARGDLDARDRFIKDARADQRSAITAQITGLKAAGDLASDQAKTILKLAELDIRRTTANSQAALANASMYRAMNPAQKIMWDTIKRGIENSNNKGEYGKKLTGPQIMDLTARTVANMRGGGAGVGGDKLNTIRVEVGKEVAKNINSKVPGQDPRYQEIRNLNAAGKTKEALKIRGEIEQELFRSRTSGLGYSGPGSLMGDGEGSLMGGGVDSLNPLGLALPEINEEQ